MKEIDPGHEYLLDEYDGYHEGGMRLVFMKREGEGYPFNKGTHPGTNCQEVIRALLDRVHYLQRQIPCEENLQVIADLRSALYQLESRAARRHGRTLKPSKVDIEHRRTCPTCGHIQCNGHRSTND